MSKNRGSDDELAELLGGVGFESGSESDSGQKSGIPSPVAFTEALLKKPASSAAALKDYIHTPKPMQKNLSGGKRNHREDELSAAATDQDLMELEAENVCMTDSELPQAENYLQNPIGGSVAHRRPSSGQNAKPLLVQNNKKSRGGE